MKIKELFSDRHTSGAGVPGSSGLPMPLIIAEVGVNHEGSMETAKRLIDEACEGGAHAVKFQSYKAATLASKDSPAYWDTSKEPTLSQYELFKRHDSFWKTEFEALKRHCDTAGIEFLSTPFDVESADYLNDLMDVVKISSSDITNMPFIRHLCSFDKPIILSTGASHPHEIMEAVSWIEAFATPLALLHCVLNYPTADENAGLGMICALRSLFPHLIIGYSDHTLPGDMQVLETAALLGARILEKHFTHDKSLPGNDHYHAMDKHDLRRFVEAMGRIRSMVGNAKLTALPSEEPARRHARRSLVAARNIPAGKEIGKDDLTWKRPAHGISPRNYDEVLGMKARTDISEDSVLRWSMLE
jgi:N-acetylneuraminate synthase